MGSFISVFIIKINENKLLVKAQCAVTKQLNGLCALFIVRSCYLRHRCVIPVTIVTN